MNDVTKRFLQAVEVLIRTGKADTQREICKKIGRSNSYITELTHKRTNARFTSIAPIADKYGVSLEWLRTGTGEMFKRADQAQATIQEPQAEYHSDNRLLDENRHLRQLLDEKEKQIILLEKLAGINDKDKSKTG